MPAGSSDLQVLIRTAQLQLAEVLCQLAQSLSSRGPKLTGLVHSHPTSRDLELSLHCSHRQHLANTPAHLGDVGQHRVFSPLMLSYTQLQSSCCGGFGVSLSGCMHQRCCKACGHCEREIKI